MILFRFGCDAVAGLKLENFSTRHSLNREKVAKVIDEIYRFAIQYVAYVIH
jgi:hypothetical protein